MDQDNIASPQLPPSKEHPFYVEGMAQIAAGQWSQAFRSFQMLQGIYPDDADVKDLFDKTQMRAALAQFQPKQTSRVKKRPKVRRLLIGALVIAVLAIAAYVAYETWINPVILQEFRVRQVTNLRNEADEAMATGDYAQARESLQALQSILPQDPQTIQDLRRVEQVERLSSLYSEAQASMAAENWDQALQALTELQSIDAQYRDLPQLLQDAKESQAMDRQFQAAEAAFAAAEWAEAITQYEVLHQANISFKFEEIQARLFESHLNYGQTLIEEAGTDPNQVSEALSHFSEGLKFQPMDGQALYERRLAETYLAALQATDLDEVIDLLQTIYQEQPDYAGRAAAQLLYTSLIKRANFSLQAGDEAATIADYQAAAQMSVEDPSEAQEKLIELTTETIPE